MSIDKKLEPFRLRINELDEQIMSALGARLKVCLEVGEFKKEYGIAMMQPARVEAVKARCAEVGREFGLRPEFAHKLYDVIITEACELETTIIDAKALSE